MKQYDVVYTIRYTTTIEVREGESIDDNLVGLSVPSSGDALPDYEYVEVEGVFERGSDEPVPKKQWRERIPMREEAEDGGAA